MERNLEEMVRKVRFMNSNWSAFYKLNVDVAFKNLLDIYTNEYLMRPTIVSFCFFVFVF